MQEDIGSGPSDLGEKSRVIIFVEGAKEIMIDPNH
jgi:hypothetical protein